MSIDPLKPRPDPCARLLGRPSQDHYYYRHHNDYDD
jgi:hypothetical protein